MKPKNKKMPDPTFNFTVISHVENPDGSYTTTYTTNNPLPEIEEGDRGIIIPKSAPGQ